MKMEAIGFDVDASVITNRVKVDLDKVRSRAVATLMRRLPVEARRDIQTEYNLKAARIRDGLSIRKTDVGVVLRGSARAINAAAFGARWSRKWAGAKVRYRKDHATTVENGTFIATGKSGNTLVFKRAGRKRLPLVPVTGVSIAQMLKHGQRPQRLADYAAGVIASELARLTR